MDGERTKEESGVWTCLWQNTVGRRRIMIMIKIILKIIK